MTDDYQQRLDYGAQVRAQQEAEKQWQQQHQQAVALHTKEVTEIIQQGNDKLGRDEMNDIGDRVADALGDKTPAVMGMLREFDDPISILEGLNRKGDVELKRFAQLSPTRQLTEIAKLQGQANPNAAVYVTDNPTWKEAPKARMTKEAFGTAISDALDDVSWGRSFEKFSRFGKGRR